jgi:hypothetical protein
LTDKDDIALNYDNLAKKVWNHYQEKIGTISKERLRLPSLKEIRQRVLDSLLDPNPQTRLLNIFSQNVLRTKLELKSPSATETPPPAVPAVPTNSPAPP